MTPLSEALTAAQRSALAALEKAYVYTGDFIVEADSEDAARAHVEQISHSTTPPDGFYFVQLIDVKELA